MLPDVTGMVAPVVDEGQIVVFPKLIVRAQAEAVRMVSAACLLMILYQIRLVLRLLPVARLLVGGVKILAVSVRVKKTWKLASWLWLYKA